ncbi:hypothetical protein EJB05_48870, partial [Eragrostis curvula]
SEITRKDELLIFPEVIFRNFYPEWFHGTGSQSPHSIDPRSHVTLSRSLSTSPARRATPERLARGGRASHARGHRQPPVFSLEQLPLPTLTPLPCRKTQIPGSKDGGAARSRAARTSPPPPASTEGSFLLALRLETAHLCLYCIRPRRLGLSMGVPKQRWTPEEEAALRAGVARHGVGNWRTILKDPEFSSTLRYRSNVDIKDKWRNMNVIVTASGSREKVKTAVKKTKATPKNNDQSTAISTVTSDAEDEIVDVKPIASVSGEACTLIPKKHQSRLDNIILEAVKNLNEPTGSHRTSIANYIELLSAKLKELTTSGKLIKVNRKYRIAPSSPYSECRRPKILLLEDIQRESFKLGSDDSKTLTRTQVDAELARMANMTAEEAAVAAARAVAEAEAILAEAEAAAREAEAAEADAQAAQAFAEAALLILKNRNAEKLVIALVFKSLLPSFPFTCRKGFIVPSGTYWLLVSCH